MHTPVIIPVASGKGGVGKSIVTASLAFVVAGKGFKTIAIDLDLGGSNLYTYLGLSNSNPGLGDYFSEKKPLEQYIVKTDFPQLLYIPGEGRTTFMANLNYLQKAKLLREIKNLNADYIFLDLGAGTSFNTLDFFDLANDGIVITTFEVPAIMNTLTFLKNYLFRKIVSLYKHNTLVSDKLKQINKYSINEQVVTIKYIIKELENINTEFGENIKSMLRDFNPRIIFNQVKNEEELNLIDKVDKGIVKNLSLKVDYFGYIFYDENIQKSVLNRNVFMQQYKNAAAFKQITKLGNKLVGS